MSEKKKKFKEFFATSWAIDNKTSVYVLTVMITLLGLYSYMNIPKEQFPEIVIPTILVSTPYPGTSPEDMENLVTRPIEKQIKSISGVKKITSNSIQDFSSVVVEFNTNQDVAQAKQKVKDAVDKAKSSLPNNLPKDPDVMEIDLSEIPIIYINFSGNYDLERLKHFAEIAQDRIEALPEITRVDIVGALEREIQINVDMFKMHAASITFSDIERAVASENLIISAGSVNTHEMKRSVRIIGQIKSPDQLNNIVLRSSSGATVYLKDIAEIKDGFKEQESFSRLGGQNVITLNVIKKSGQNLINASDKIKKIVHEDLKGVIPPDVNITVSGDMSRFTRNTLEELNNTIVIGFILVTLVLMFFMGFSTAFFVALSVPLSMFVAYLVMPGLGFTMNMIVMFGFIFALGIIVDDAIVVIENTHRIHRFEPNIKIAAKRAAGEVFLPILSGTLTTLAPFFPLAFWPGTVGKFMHYMPVTLILTLFASLFVAYIINPVFAVEFMKHEYDTETRKGLSRRKLIRICLVMLGFALLFHLVGWFGMGNFMIFLILLFAIYHLWIQKAIHWWQDKGWPWILKGYDRALHFVIKGRRPYNLVWGIVVLFFLSIFLLSVKKPQVRFFPDNEPNNIYVLLKLPVGTDQKITDSLTRILEEKVYQVIGKNNPDVESVISNVALGAGEGGTFDRSIAHHQGKVTINFVEYKFRKGPSTTTYLDKLRSEIRGFPGAAVTVMKNQMGPPTGKPISIEISGENIHDLITTSQAFKHYLDSIQIPGIEELKTDFDETKPEIIIDIDRVRANMEGISTAQIGMEIRNALFGKEISKFKKDEDEFPIMVRVAEEQRKNINQLMSLKVIYRDMNSGILRQIPLSSVAKISYGNSYGGIKRKNLKRVITISSNVLSGYSANDIVPRIKQIAQNFQVPEGVEITLTGEREDQAETMQFLVTALIIALGLIFFILISQFNSFSKTFIILSEVVFSIIGVFLGIVIFNIPVSVTMTGLGVVALAGIVVRNGILLVEFTDVLRERGMKTKQAIIEAGKTRITPVVLTATAAILGLIPLAIGMNIDFIGLFTELNPHIHFGGDNVMFWGGLSWTIIVGLAFATFLTLLFVPAMYYIAHGAKIRVSRGRSNRKARRLNNV